MRTEYLMTILNIVFAPTVLATLALLSGCADAGTYPSLNPRPIELKAKEMLNEPAPTAPVLAPSNPALLAKIAGLVGQARDSDAAFRTALNEARSVVAAGAGKPGGSEAWVAAQLALSRVEAKRAPVGAVLAELDEERRTLLLGPESADTDALERASAQVETLDATQRQEMTQLSDRLTPR
jgi:hypothetical protein